MITFLKRNYLKISQSNWFIVQFEKGLITGFKAIIYLKNDYMEISLAGVLRRNYYQLIEAIDFLYCLKEVWLQL